MLEQHLEAQRQGHWLAFGFVTGEIAWLRRGSSSDLGVDVRMSLHELGILAVCCVCILAVEEV